MPYPSVGVTKSELSEKDHSLLQALPKAMYIAEDFETTKKAYRITAYGMLIFLIPLFCSILLDIILRKSGGALVVLMSLALLSGGGALLLVLFLFFGNQKSPQDNHSAYGLYLLPDTLVLYEHTEQYSIWPTQSIKSITRVTRGHKPTKHYVLITYHLPNTSAARFFYLPESLHGHAYELEKRLQDWLRTSQNKIR